MILLIGCGFVGLLTVLGMSQLGWLATVPVVGAVLLIAAGIQNLSGNKPIDPRDIAEVAQGLRQLSDHGAQRATEASRGSHPARRP
jgi:hypothetical protein